MRFLVLLSSAWLTLALLGCSASVPSAIAPGGSIREPPRPPPPPLAPAPAPPIAQPDPDGPHAREVRAEVLLGRIARMAGRLRFREDDARADRDRGRAACIEGKLGELDAIERAAAGARDRLRASLFDEGEAASIAWADLAAQVERAEAIASEATECVGQDPLMAGGFGPNDARLRTAHEFTKRVAPRVLRMRTRAPLEEYDAPDDSFSGKGLSKDSTAAHYASLVSLAPGGGAGNAPAPSPAPVSPTVVPTGEAAHDSSMLLRSAQLALAVFEVEKNVDAVEKIASEAGGYLALRGDRQITVRVPKTRFDDTIRRIERLGDVLHRNVSSEDVTDQYVDLELRLKNAVAVRARLEKLLEHATVKDAVEIHRELAKVTDEIERLEGKLKLLKDRVAFSTITVTFERSQTQQVRAQALLPFPWMQTMGLEPLLKVNR